MTEALSKALQEVEVLIDRVQRLEANNTPKAASTTKTSQQKAPLTNLIAPQFINDNACPWFAEIRPHVTFMSVHA